MGQVGHAWLAQTYGWQAPFQAASVHCLIAALGVYLYYRPPHDLPHVGRGKGVGMAAQEWSLVICSAGAWGVFNAAYVTYLAFEPKVLEGHGQSEIGAHLLLGLAGAGVGASLFFGLIGMAPAGVIMAMAGQAMRPQVRAFGMGIRKTAFTKEIITADEMGIPCEKITRVVAMPVVKIPFSGVDQSDLSPLCKVGALLG